MADDMNLSEDNLNNEECKQDSSKTENEDVSKDAHKECLEKKPVCEDVSQTEKDSKSQNDPVSVLQLSCESEVDDSNFIITLSPSYTSSPVLAASTPIQSNGTKDNFELENIKKNEDSLDTTEKKDLNSHSEITSNSECVDNTDKSMSIPSEQKTLSEDEPMSPPAKRRHIDDNLSTKNSVSDNSKDLVDQIDRSDENSANETESISEILDGENQKNKVSTNEESSGISPDSTSELKTACTYLQEDNEQNDWCLQLSAATQPVETEKSPSPVDKDTENATENLTENKSEEATSDKNNENKESLKDMSENNNNGDDLQKSDQSKPLFQIHKPSCIQEINPNINNQEESTVFSCVQKLNANTVQSSEKSPEECAVTPMECDIPAENAEQSNNNIETEDFVLNLSETATQNAADENKIPEDDKELFEDEHNSDVSMQAQEDAEKMKAPICPELVQPNYSCKETQTDIAVNNSSKSVETETTNQQEKETTEEVTKEKGDSTETMLLDKSFLTEKLEFGIQVDTLCSKCGGHQNVKKLKDSGICKKIVTVVRHITTKQIIIDGKVVKTLVVEEEDDPCVEFIEGTGSPIACSSHSHSPTLISHSSLTSGELTDVSSLITSKSANSSNSSTFFTLPAHSSLSRNTFGDKSVISPKSVQFQDLSNIETTPKRKSANTYVSCNEDQSKLSSSNLTSSSRSYSPEISYPEAVSSNVSRSVLPGLRVMAKWKDGYYYPGTICSQISDTRWTVLFDDGDSKPIWEKDLIAISLLKKGQAVYALSEDGCYDQGIIRDYYRDGKEIGYIIEKEYNEFEKYPRSSVTLSSEQANSLIKSNSEITESPSGINLDNIIEGKRRHSSRSNSSREKKQKSPRNLDYNKYRNILERKSSSEEINNIGKSLKQSGMKQNTRSSRSSDSKSDIISDFKQETPQKKKVSDCKRILSWKSSMNEGSDENIKVLQKSSFLSNNQSNDQPTHTFKSPRIQKAEKCKLSKLTGEIGKVEKKRLFVGYAFLLTSAEKKTDNKEFLSSDSCVDISEEEVIDEYPFEKSVVQNQIEARGGIVLESIEEIQTVKANQIFLLSNTYLRTIKYIHCLAASIPCISHLWVRDCCKTNKIQSFKTYLLPAGFNIIEKCEIEWHGKKGVLKDIHILLASSKENFAEVWTPVLLAAQAEIVHRFPPPRNTSGSVCNIDIVLTDPSCPQSIVRRANQMKVPLVSIEWVVQCLISGYKLPIDLHPKFSYDA